ncbi:MAG TPA: type I glyceraldehyde-3-phosphate dehydrogenase [Thermoanaerobaculia bacterium]|nr:type I glyceraldehyde-3-phosphate dehydrogenase [Thermoanaerobaculia bacterium]
MTRVALMGFGRIGRNLFRTLYKRDDIRVVAISDVADPKALEYLLRFDTLLGRFPDLVSIKDGNLYVWGRQVRMLNGEEGETLRWDELGVDVVLETTARPLPRAALARHLERGAKRVIQCSPPSEPLDLTVVRGVNDDLLRPEHRIVSNASSTVHCAAPVLKILDEAFGIERAMFTTIHAYTNWHRLADVPADDMRRGRAAPENIIPQESRSPRMLEELLPSLAGKITGAAMNVPVRNGSAVDLVCWHTRKVTPAAINEVVRTAADGRYAGVVSYVDDPIVSCDVVKSDFSSTFDSLATMVLGERLSKTLSWYDAGWGYAQRVVDLVTRFAGMEAGR